MSNLSQAIKEAYASVDARIVILETIQFSHEDLPGGDLFFVKNTETLSARLETGELVSFAPIGFAFVPPKKDSSGVPEMSISVDNINQEVSDYVYKVSTSSQPVYVTYRVYLSNDTSGPQINPPLRLTLKEATIDQFQVSARAAFADVRNKQFLSQKYTRDRFQALGG